MPRTIWIIDGPKVSAKDEADATAAGCTEIVVGVPPSLRQSGIAPDTRGAVTIPDPPPDPTTANGQALRDRLRNLLDGNKTYLARTTPTAAQQTAQIERLTREVSALMRLVLADLSDISDT